MDFPTNANSYENGGTAKASPGSGGFGSHYGVSSSARWQLRSLVGLRVRYNVTLPIELHCEESEAKEEPRCLVSGVLLPAINYDKY